MSNTKLFCRTGEVTALLDLEPHIIRYWETQFPRFVRPIRRADGRRLYRNSDVDALTAIKKLVRHKGFTIKAAVDLLDNFGVQKILEEAPKGSIGIMNVRAPDRTENLNENNKAARSAPVSAKDEDNIPAGLVSERLSLTLNRLESIKAKIDGSDIIESGRLTNYAA